MALLLILRRALLLVLPVRHCLVHHLALLLIDCVTPAKMYNVRNNSHLKLVLFNTARVKNRPALCPREFVALFPRPNILRGGSAKQCLFIFRADRTLPPGGYSVGLTFPVV